MNELLISRVRANMHIVLCMSPIGDAFRNRLRYIDFQIVILANWWSYRQYPALVNCTTIDWFHEWPKEALLEVARKFIADVNFSETITGKEGVSCTYLTNPLTSLMEILRLQKGSR